MPPGNPKKPNIAPKGKQNGAQHASQNACFGDLPDVSWIYYLLYLEHIGLPRVGPKKPPNSKQVSEVLWKPIFNGLGWIWASTWGPIWHHFGSFSGVRFLSGFWSRFWVDEGHDPGTAVPSWRRIGGKGASPLVRILTDPRNLARLAQS